jgi:hypothetical protein
MNSGFCQSHGRNVLHLKPLLWVKLLVWVKLLKLLVWVKSVQKHMLGCFHGALGNASFESAFFDCKQEKRSTVVLHTNTPTHMHKTRPCAHTHTRTHTHTNTHTQTHTGTYTHLYMHTRAHIHAHTHTRICTHTAGGGSGGSANSSGGAGSGSNLAGSTGIPHLSSVHQELAQLAQGGSHGGLDALRLVLLDCVLFMSYGCVCACAFV